jgi:hypothetical protein
LSKAGPAAPVIQPLLIIIQACIPVNQILDTGQCPHRTPGHPPDTLSGRPFSQNQSLMSGTKIAYSKCLVAANVQQFCQPGKSRKGMYIHGRPGRFAAVEAG